VPPPHSIYQPLLNGWNTLKPSHSIHNVLNFSLNGEKRP
jgi:hypothetical protein